ncbi:proline--tRNA ligase, partial [Candidatus Woesearchaeota archaeon]
DEDSGERLALRPTSETIMYDSYAKWIRSWRDLPLRINQWANVVRWETEQTKLFLRSREFLWQEGHNVYETLEECDIETEMMIKEYQKLCKDVLALPTTIGRKSDREKFAGAVYTLTIEAFMPDGKALQCGTSHNLGQGFAKAFGISFQDREGNNGVLPWQNSWGFSTRLIGATVMLHSDDKGLVLPPKVAKNKVVIVPILFEDSRDAVIETAELLADKLKQFNPYIDDREEHSPGFKFSEWELKGVPLRIEIGPKDLDSDSCVVVRRDTGEKQIVEIKDVAQVVEELLEAMHNDLYDKALELQERLTVSTNSYEEFKKMIEARKRVQVSFCGREECEEKVKEETGASSRCQPLDDPEPKHETCFACKEAATANFYFSKSY